MMRERFACARHGENALEASSSNERRLSCSPGWVVCSPLSHERRASDRCRAFSDERASAKTFAVEWRQAAATAAAMAATAATGVRDAELGARRDRGCRRSSCFCDVFARSSNCVFASVASGGGVDLSFIAATFANRDDDAIVKSTASIRLLAALVARSMLCASWRRERRSTRTKAAIFRV